MPKGTKELEYKHWFYCINGKLYWERPDFLRAKIHMLDGKKGYAIITYAEDPITPNQYAFYYGGIIRGECMHSNCFQNVGEKEIHDILFGELRSYTKEVIITKKDGTIEHKMAKFTEDFGNYGKKKMSEYLEELIPYLQDEYGIIVKDPKEYKYNQYSVTRRQI